MTAAPTPSMATATASLERSLRNCSISSASSPPLDQPIKADQDTETHDQLDFHVSLPCHWEQCIDFKTGDTFYINRWNGRKFKEDPRKLADERFNNTGDHPSSSKEENNSSPPPPPPTTTTTTSPSMDDFNYEEHVLVVAGCKRCLMYFMLPKAIERCPKCNKTDLLLHFDQPEN